MSWPKNWLKSADREIAGENHVITIKNKKNGPGLKQAVEEISGVDISVCFQCKKCSSGCPVAKLTKSRPFGNHAATASGRRQ